MPKTVSRQPTAEQEKLMMDLKKQMPPDMDAQEILAVVSQFVGQLIALQDRRRMTPEMALQVVQENIEIGNQAAMLLIGPVAGSG